MASVAEQLATLASTLRQTVARGNLQSYVPHAKQFDFHRSTARTRLYIGGNRGGKTTAGATEALWWATRRHPYRRVPDRPVKGRVIGVDYDHGIAMIVLPEIRRWVIPSDLISGSWESSFNKRERTLHLANGSFIEFMSAESDLEKFAGVSRDFIWFDEECPQPVFTENRARTIDVAGSVWVTMTPIEGQNWSYDQLYLPGKGEEVERDRDVDVVEVDMAENPHLDPAEIARFVASLSDEEREARVHGRYVALGGLIYRGFDPDTHVVAAGPPPAGWPIYTSMDHGLANPTAWLWHAVGPAGQVLTFHEHYAPELTVEAHAGIVRAYEGTHGIHTESRVGDPAITARQQANGMAVSIQQEYIRHGLAIMLGNNDVEAGINRVRRYLQVPLSGSPRWQVSADCVNLIREMRRYRWRTFLSRKMRDRANAFETPLKKDDHAADALRYFLMSRPDIAALGPVPPPAPYDPRLAPGQQPSLSAPVMAQPVDASRIVRLRRPDSEHDPDLIWEYSEHMGSMW